MSEIVTLDHLRAARRDDSLWAVIASAGAARRVAEIYPSRDAALADQAWREQQVQGVRAMRCCAAHQPGRAALQRGADPPRRPAAKLDAAAGAGLSARAIRLAEARQIVCSQAGS